MPVEGSSMLKAVPFVPDTFFPLQGYGIARLSPIPPVTGGTLPAALWLKSVCISYTRITCSTYTVA